MICLVFTLHKLPFKMLSHFNIILTPKSCFPLIFYSFSLCLFLLLDFLFFLSFFHSMTLFLQFHISLLLLNFSCLTPYITFFVRFIWRFSDFFRNFFCFIKNLIFPIQELTPTSLKELFQFHLLFSPNVNKPKLGIFIFFYIYTEFKVHVFSLH